MSFERLAPHYDWLEAFNAGRRLDRARTVWLDRLAGARRLLSAGEGHGRFAAACALRHPALRIDCLEPSDGMWRRAEGRFARQGVPTAHLARLATALPGAALPPATYDAIATCFFLDCFPPAPLAAVVAELAAAATPDARWLHVDFAVPTRGPARWRALAVHALMYQFFRVATRLPARRLTPPDPLLAAAGFRLVARREFDWGLLRAELWQR